MSNAKSSLFPFDPPIANAGQYSPGERECGSAEDKTGSLPRAFRPGEGGRLTLRVPCLECLLRTGTQEPHKIIIFPIISALTEKRRGIRTSTLKHCSMTAFSA
ncbi:hypothetical protein AVEN_240486-1 [Araneus ventricosus]|uniref:Uncharacterized protein n=1 Tax=Araneus ventricosus TaxID=182803 RepID=A0A4Y2HLU1_ARAVE|nr:hypothetical protein AVEN_240486-1 [Araneus ventricosus]